MARQAHQFIAFLLLLIAVHVVLPVANASQPAAADSKLQDKQVLLLYSYHPTFPTAPQALAGIRSAFGEQGPKLHIEYMDSKRLYDATSRENFTQQFKYKIASRPAYDLVITADDNALNLMLETGMALIPNTPVVFLGVNDIERAVSMDQNPLVTGVVEAASFKETIALMQRLQPSRKSLHIVVDSTPSGQADLATVTKITNQFPNLQFHTLSLTQLSWGVLQQQLSLLGRYDQVLLLSAYRDKRNISRSFDESMKMIHDSAKVPVYHLWEHGMGDGILGGVLISHHEQGRQAGLMAKRILEGTDINQIPVLRQSPNVATFDYRQLARFHIDTELLPESSKVLFRPTTIWQNYQPQILFIIVIFGLMSLFILYLIKQNKFRRTALNEIRSKEEQLRTTLNSIGDAVVSVDIDGNILSVNPVAEELAGKSAQQLEGQPFAECFSFFDTEAVSLPEFPPQSMILDEPNAELANYTILISQHHAKYQVAVSSKPAQQEEGHFSGAVVVFRDVTEEQQIRMALEDSETRFRDFAASAADWFWEMGADLTFTYFSGRIEQVTGCKAMDFIGKSRIEVYGPDQDFDSPAWQQHLVTVEQHLPFTDFEIRWTRPDGDIRFLTISGKPLFDNQGEFIGYRGIGRDVTERIQVAERVRQMDAMYRNLVENIPGAAYRCLMDQHWSMEYISQGIEELTGYPPSDFINNRRRSYASIIHPDDVAMVDEAVKAAIANDQPFILNYRIIHADGSIRWIWERGRACEKQDGSGSRLEGVMADVTEQKRTEETLRRAQKMDAVGQMAGGIAHDFNNILGIILGNLALLKQHINNDAKTLKRVEVIEESAQRAAGLTKQLLGFSRKLATERTSVNLNKIINHMSSLIARSITPQVEVTHHLAKGLWATDLDPGDFENALLNLIINARDAMPEGGQLVIETRNATLTPTFCTEHPGATPGDYVMLSVSDTGSGIPPEVQERIFEPFFTTKPPGQGTGLGLAMVFGFVKRSEGYIQATSHAGAGTRFDLYLPRGAETASAMETPSTQASTPPMGSHRILVVDDEEELLNLAREALEALGYQVLTASDGRMALSILQQQPDIDLLFSDVVMPGGINGYALAKQASELYPQLKILLTSGHADNIAASDSDSYPTEPLRKPYSLLELARCISELLQD